MARYTKIVKISESKTDHIYEIYNNSDIVDCYAVLDTTQNNIRIYRDLILKKLIFDYQEMKKKPDYIWPNQSLFILALLNLIPALEKGIFPDDLSRCS